MLAYQLRVVDEKAELDTKLAALRSFFATSAYAALDPAERERLRRQEAAMHDYSDVLAERIDAF